MTPEDRDLLINLSNLILKIDNLDKSAINDAILLNDYIANSEDQTKKMTIIETIPIIIEGANTNNNNLIENVINSFTNIETEFYHFLLKSILLENATRDEVEDFIGQYINSSINFTKSSDEFIYYNTLVRHAIILKDRQLIQDLLNKLNQI